MRITVPGIDGLIAPKVADLWFRYYPNHDSDSFSRFVESYIHSDAQILEIGAGSGLGIQKAFPFKGKCRRYVGIDIDPRVLQNPSLDEGQVADAASIPFADETFDLVFHTMVAEHLVEPGKAIREMARILKPGGILLFETPSRYYYPMLVATLTPHSFHQFYVKHFGSGRDAHDIFRTIYGLNARNDVNHHCSAANLIPSIEYKAGPPGYLRFNRLAFIVGVLYERILERAFPPLRQKIWVKATKPKIH
jgi:SAM-dependent methyltransferase